MPQFPVINMCATGHNISCLRQKKGLTVRELQRLMGFRDPQAIYKWQRGECLPTIDNLVILSHIFQVPIDNILAIECDEDVVALYDDKRKNVHTKFSIRRADDNTRRRRTVEAADKALKEESKSLFGRIVDRLKGKKQPDKKEEDTCAAPEQEASVRTEPVQDTAAPAEGNRTEVRRECVLPADTRGVEIVWTAESKEQKLIWDPLRKRIIGKDEQTNFQQ